MSNGETPGIGGVVGLAKLSTKAPRAWQGMINRMTKDIPAGLRKSQRARSRMSRL